MTRFSILVLCLALLACQAGPTIVVDPCSSAPEAIAHADLESSNPQLTDMSDLSTPDSTDSVETVVPPQNIVDITTMIEIPAGKAVIGSTKAEAKRAKKLCESDSGSTRDDCTRDYAQETPRRVVNIPGFWIDEHEVAEREYQECVEVGHCTKPNDDEIFCDTNTFLLTLSNHPINCVNWHQAVAYCDWKGQRLPSADEWEKAARGQSGQKFPWGEDAVPCEKSERPSRGRCDDWTALEIGEEDRTTAPIGSAPIDQSPYGVIDMAGNVAEWTATKHNDGVRLVKGAMLSSTLDKLRSAAVFFMQEDEASAFVGFRCAYSEDEPEAAQQPQLEVDAL